MEKEKPKVEKFLRKTYPESHRVFHFDKQLLAHKDIVEVAGYFEDGKFVQVGLWEDYVAQQKAEAEEKKSKKKKAEPKE